MYSLVASSSTSQGSSAATLERIREMFTFGYDSYMRHAYPEDELNPIRCRGRGHDFTDKNNINVNDVLGNYQLTLVDSLDSLAVCFPSSFTITLHSGFWKYIRI